MKPARFRYHAPERLDDALALLADDRHEVRPLAGGQSLVPMMNFRLAVPDVLVDLRRIAELRFVEVRGDGALVVGAGTPQAELLRDHAVAARWPVLAEAIRHIGHPQIRSRGTVGGALVHHDPTGELPAVALTLGASMVVAGPGGSRRTVAAADFFVSYYEVALEPGELLVEVVFPPPPAGWSFRELARRRIALVGAITLIERAAGVARTPRVVAFGVADRPVRLAAAEALLDGAAVDDGVLAELRTAVTNAVEPGDDAHASAEHRRECVGQLVVEAVAEAWERSGDG